MSRKVKPPSHWSCRKKVIIILIQQRFDAFCLAKALSSELRLRAVHCLRARNLQAFQAFLLPGPTAEAADSTLSSLYPHSSIPSFPQRPVYALQALRLCHLGDILDHQGPAGLANGGLSSWKQEVVRRSGSGADGGLAVGIFIKKKKKRLWTRQEREGMIICGQILKYRGLLLLLCVARWSFIISLLFWRKI